jgi:aryl-alcohol dehydrogenase-like predicted oxidoreductase
MLTRRKLLRDALVAASGFGVGVSRAQEAAVAVLPSRTFGKTGLTVPILGFGGASLPSRWRNPLAYEDRVALVRYAYDCGVRYFDTAGNYLESQAILGQALKDYRRDVCLVTKVETTRPEEGAKGRREIPKARAPDRLCGHSADPRLPRDWSK